MAFTHTATIVRAFSSKLKYVYIHVRAYLHAQLIIMYWYYYTHVRVHTYKYAIHKKRWGKARAQLPAHLPCHVNRKDMVGGALLLYRYPPISVSWNVRYACSRLWKICVATYFCAVSIVFCLSGCTSVIARMK